MWPKPPGAQFEYSDGSTFTRGAAAWQLCTCTSYSSFLLLKTTFCWWEIPFGKNDADYGFDFRIRVPWVMSMRVKQTPHSRERGGDQVQLVLFILVNDGPGARWPGQNMVNIIPDAVLSTNSLHQPAAGGRSRRRAQPIPHFMASLRQKHGK